MLHMFATFVVLGFVATVLAAVFAPVRVRFFYVREEGRGQAAVDLRVLWGAVRKTWVWPAADPLPALLEHMESEEWRESSLYTGWRVLRLWKRHSGLRRMVRLFLRGVTIGNWKTRIRFGTGDAASTGVLVGVFWSFFYAAAAMLGSRVRLCRPEVRVTPVFRDRTLEVEIEGIAHFRAGQAIGAGVAMAIVLWKEGLLWRSTRLKA